MSLYWRMLGYLRPYIWPQGVFAVLFMLAFSALESSLPFLVRYTQDQIFAAGRADMLGWVVMAVGAPRSSAAF